MGRTGPRRGGQTAPLRVADLVLFTAAAFFLFFIFYGSLVSFSRLSRAAFNEHDAWTAGVWNWIGLAPFSSKGLVRSRLGDKHRSPHPLPPGGGQRKGTREVLGFRESAS